MRSAYEIALERLGDEGIRPPSENALDADVKAEMAAIRRKTESDLAQLEILHRDRLAKMRDPGETRAAEERYREERRRIESRSERRLQDLRGNE